MRVTIDQLRAACANSPQEAAAAFDYATALTARGENAIAAAVLRDAAARMPANARAHYELGRALAFEAGNAIRDSARAVEAERSLDTAIRLDPNHAGSYLAIAELYEHILESSERAESALVHTIHAAPNLPEAYDRLARLCVLTRAAREAGPYFRSLIPSTTPAARFHYAMAAGYSRCGRYDLAWYEFDNLAAAEPDNLNALIGFAYTGMALGDIRGATEFFAKAHRLYPWSDVALVHFLQHLLRIGDREKAQALFRGHIRLRKSQPFAQPGGLPDWDGTDPQGKTIVISALGGFGDGMQFTLFASFLRDLGAKVIVECQSKIRPLIATIPGVDLAVLPYDARPDGDYQCRSYFLCLLLDWTWDSFHARAPFFRLPASARNWRGRLPGDKFNVGICWRCGASDKRSDPYTARGMRLEQLLPLASLPDIQLVNLQIGAASEIGATFGDGVVLDLIEEGSFSNAAELMSCLDAVVTVDTATAHVAGALGVNGVVLLPYFADWRWFTDRERCEFYPSLRLARQQSPGDWTAPVASARELLTAIPARQAMACG